jgi:hypothetical protein
MSSCTRFAAWVVAGMVSGCATVEAPPPTPAPASGPEFANAGFEAEAPPGQRCPIRWICTVHADPSAFRFELDETTPFEGRRSLRIEPSGNEPWAVVSQGLPVGRWEGATLRLTFALRLSEVTGKGAGPFFLAQSGVGRRVGHKQQLLLGTAGWQRVAMDFEVPPGTVLMELGAILDGKGRIWIDDLKVEVLRAPEAGKKPV